MGIESSLANFMRDKEEYIKNSSNPRKARRAMESSFRRMVKDGTVVLLPKGGFTTSKEFVLIFGELTSISICRCFVSEGIPK